MRKHLHHDPQEEAILSLCHARDLLEKINAPACALVGRVIIALAASRTQRPKAEMANSRRRERRRKCAAALSGDKTCEGVRDAQIVS
jgi:hypothetical protein